MSEWVELVARLHRTRRLIVAVGLVLALFTAVAMGGPLLGALLASRLADLAAPGLTDLSEVARLVVIYAGSLVWSLPFAAAMVGASGLWHRSVAQAYQAAGIASPSTGIQGPLRVFAGPALLAVGLLVVVVGVGIQVLAAQASEPGFFLLTGAWVLLAALSVLPGAAWAAWLLQDRPATRQFRQGTLRAEAVGTARPFPLIDGKARSLVRANLHVREGDLDAAESVLVQHLQQHGVTPVESLTQYAEIRLAKGDIDHAARIYAAAASLRPFSTGALDRLAEILGPHRPDEASWIRTEAQAFRTGLFGTAAPTAGD